MENIGTAGDEGPGAGGPGLLHSNYNCDISLRQQQLHSGHDHHHLALQDREKSFSVNHLLELPGQAHLYQEHPGQPDSLSSDLQRVSQALSAEHHHRLNSHQLKLQEGKNDGHLSLHLVYTTWVYTQHQQKKKLFSIDSVKIKYDW